MFTRITAPNATRNRKQRLSRAQSRGRAARRAWQGLEALEPRTLYNASPGQIANALDLPTGTVVTVTGDPSAVSTRVFFNSNGFLGFPSGRDEDFMYISSGIADWIDTVGNTGGSQGTDLGASGTGGDTATFSFSLPVPASSQAQRFKFDFRFGSDEFPEFVNSQYNDFLNITVNGTDVALDENGNDISINSAYFSGSPAGTFWDGATSFLTGAYPVPNGVNTLNVVISIGDVGDGIYDSGAILDNFRFETQQVVFLNFNGKTLVNHYDPGVSLTHPAFSATDIGFSAGDTATKITEITNAVAAKFAAYDALVTNVMPASGDFMEVVIGGNNDVVVNINQAQNPLLFNAFGATEPYQNLLGAGSTLYGQAQRVDIGNQFRSDLAGVFSGEHNKQATAADNQKDLVNVIAHEASHNLGLRHVTNANSTDIMARRGAIPRSLDAIFNDTLMNLHEAWPDNTKQNDHQNLLSILGPANLNAGLLPAFNIIEFLNFFTADLSQGGTLYDVTVGIASADGDGEGTPDEPPQLFTFDQLGGPFQIPIFAPEGSQFFFMGASQDGGPMNVFSGTPTGGNLSYEDLFVDLFDESGEVNTEIPIAKGEPGSIVPFGILTLVESELGDVSFLPGNTGTFTDTDGDVYKVKLKGGGTLAMNLDDPDADGNGPIASLIVDQATAKSKLSVNVIQTVGDGIVTIGNVAADLLKDFKAPNSDLIGGGIVLQGTVKTVVLHDMLNGAGINAPGVETNKTSITARSIGDGSIIDLGLGQIKKLKAASIGDANINASIAKSIIVGSDGDVFGIFSAELNLSHASTSLGKLTVSHGIIDATITTAGDIGKVTTPLVKNSNFFAGFNNTPAGLPDSTFDFNNAAAKIKKLTVTGNFDPTTIPGLTLAEQPFWFINSNIAAPTIQKLTLGHVKFLNNAAPFGFAANSITKLKYTDNNGVLHTTTNQQAIVDFLDDDDAVVNLFDLLP